MKFFYLALVGIVSLCLLLPQATFGQLVISQEAWGNDGVLPTSHSLNLGLGTYDQSAMDWELYAQYRQTTEDPFRNEHFVSSQEGQELRLGLRFYPFGVQDGLLWQRNGHRRNKRLAYHRSQAARGRLRARRKPLHCGLPVRFHLPGLHLGVNYAYATQLEEVKLAAESVSYDQSIQRTSIGVEVGYSLSLECLHLGLHWLPVQYNWTEYSSNNPSPFSEPPNTKTQGLAFLSSWRIQVGIRLW